jgi:hypothetical protein
LGAQVYPFSNSRQALIGESGRPSSKKIGFPFACKRNSGYNDEVGQSATMKSPIPDSGVVLSLACLEHSKLQAMGVTPQHLRRLFHLIPLRERHALNLYHFRGVRQRELAALMGISPRSVGRLLDRARARLRDPVNLAFIGRWRRLDPAERRLVNLHRFKGIPLREIARLGLVTLPPEDEAAPAPAPSDRRAAALPLRDLQAFWRRLERRGQRWAERRQRTDAGGDAEASGGDASSSG